jgi:Spy/CpxP family protein refolding chaperone
MKRTFLNLAGAAALVAGMAFGQNPPASSQQQPYRQRGQAGGTMQRETMVDRLSTELNLTPTQKQQAEQIFGASRQAAQPVHDQLRQQRQALASAVKANNTSDIDRISNSMGPLMAQATANRAKAFAQFYQILTPEQKTAMDARMEGMMEGRGPHAQPHGAPPPTR